jgi:lipopolysaccharide transport system ATP-binding protein
MKPIIKVEDLSKQYHIGARKESYSTLRDTIAGAVRAPFNRWRRNGHSVNNTIWALKDVSFEVAPGEALGVIGRNGAGKSTLLKILSRITDPTTGQVELYGRVGSLLEVGTGFHPELTGRENVFLNGAVMGMRREEVSQKFDEIVAFSEIDQFIDTPVKRYSSGMYMRLAFAVAAHLNPEILIVDEVLAVGDASFQKKCLGKMGDVAHEGRTVLFVSHNIASIQRLCTSVILLSGGKVAARGPATDVTQLYLQSGAANLLSWQRAGPPAAAAYFQKVYLSDQTGESLECVTTASSLRINMELVVRDAPRDMQLSVTLSDGYDMWLISSSPQDAGLSPPTEPGHYNAVMHFPSEFLVARTYGLRVGLWSPSYGHIDVVDDLRFQAQETASLANSTPLGRAGLIALRCAWEIDKVSGD